MESFFKYGLLWSALWIVAIFFLMRALKRLGHILGWCCFLMLTLANVRFLLGEGNYERLLRATRKYYPPEVQNYITEVLGKSGNTKASPPDDTAFS